MGVTDGSGRVAALMDEGMALMGRGRWREAEERFRAAAALSPLPAARNNWAMCRHLAGDHAEALTILAPLLAGPAPLPFTRALASQANAALGQRVPARKLLQAAIRDFERGLADPALRGEVGPAVWIEYSVQVKRAAGILGDHRLVVDLHERWPGSDLPDGAFAAGVAAFNLGRYAQAARYWRGIEEPTWVRLMQGYAGVAEQAQAGVVPHFPLGYDLAEDTVDARPASDEEVRRLMARGSVRMRHLAMVFEESAPNRGMFVAGLITYGGTWGVEFGRRLLKSDIPLALKAAAAGALVERGVFPPDKGIPIIHEGRRTTIHLREVEVKTDDPELERRYREAIRLRDAGDREGAFRLLNAMHKAGHCYPPALLALANLMRWRGQLEEAQALLEMLERLDPDEPAVPFNLAALWLQRGDLEQARRYFQRIDRRNLPASFCRKMAELERALR